MLYDNSNFREKRMTWDVFVIFIFFVLSFVVFVTIKYAAIGVKAAYQAVNDPESFRAEMAAPHFEADIKLAGIACSTLGIQVALMGSGNPRHVPQKARDKWSLGYVLGFSRALSGNRRDAPRAEERVPLVVFRFLFGDGQGHQLYSRVQSLIATGDGATRDGFRTGQSDIVRWLTSSDGENAKVPMGWWAHYQNTFRSSSPQVLKG